ncbi:precorrin-6y C5,15-methyltransferase (decarboxylating) subunit CbiE [Nakamurella sp. YIM 132087]|uniref:Precorrin-6y C5,15-methyltransferase (Decarboxylating) subunit CbiE n=1 Tax=Nakamurella alba TaxID=2665158 RepID=A0A7K1FJM3_9ACTN|nr:precorrin-6y C5,15-methyltransferase (decarboxylating) subunit CbiE [Nakamurella alba]MTD13064.1 precorrin-6y C5,15-methyltransferase (decarboxylating) subunit CbiE [Nakamurella alba]
MSSHVSATASTPAPIAVVGIGADGWPGLDDHRRRVLTGAATVVGGPRQLTLLPDDVGARRTPLPRPLRDRLPALLEQAAAPVVVLASGDPLLSGIGSTLLDLLGPDAVEVLPHLSSVTLARARMGWRAEDVAVVSAVGRPLHPVLREIHPDARIVVLSADSGTPAALAALLTRHGHGNAAMTVLADLGGAELRLDGTPGAWPDVTVPDLNLVCLHGFSTGSSTTPGLPDEAYEHDGQLTKRELRAAALARLGPRTGELLWDLGAGAGSIAIEWCRQHPHNRAVAVESDPERADRISRNASRLGVTVSVVTGRTPDALTGLPDPDAVFVGGGLGGEGGAATLRLARESLRPGGRLVAHAVTLEGEQSLLAAAGTNGGDLTRISVERALPLGRWTGWTPARPVVQWALDVPREGF